LESDFVLPGEIVKYVPLSLHAVSAPEKKSDSLEFLPKKIIGRNQFRGGEKLL